MAALPQITPRSYTAEAYRGLRADLEAVQNRERGLRLALQVNQEFNAKSAAEAEEARLAEEAAWQNSNQWQQEAEYWQRETNRLQQLADHLQREISHWQQEAQALSQQLSMTQQQLNEVRSRQPLPLLIPLSMAPAAAARPQQGVGAPHVMAFFTPPPPLVVMGSAVATQGSATSNPSAALPSPARQ
jgi:hypothetical protein